MTQRVWWLVLLLLLSGAGPVLSQGPNLPKQYRLNNQILLKLEKGSMLGINYERYEDLLRHKNIDSVLHLFVQDYDKIRDTTRPLDGRRVTFHVNRHLRNIQVEFFPQKSDYFGFREGDDQPVQLKTGTDTLLIPGWSDNEASRRRIGYYLILNNIDQVRQYLSEGGFNTRIDSAQAEIIRFKKHPLTKDRVSYRLEMTGRKAEFSRLHSQTAGFLSIQPRVEAGLVRHRLVPSLVFDVQVVPNSFHRLGYSIGIRSDFFFRERPEGGYTTERNDFLNFGLHIYKKESGEKRANFNKLFTSLYVGIPIRRRGDYFDSNTIRIGGTAYTKGLVRIQPELYMNGFFRNVFPGVRVGFGL